MRLIIPAAVEAKLHAYVRSVNTEIAGMGKAKVGDDGNIMLLDVAIYEQEVTGGTADLSSEALAKFQTELIQNGESPKDWIVWWHSHADMSAFFSSRDTSTIDSSNEFQYLVSLVVNRKRERKARVDTYRPFRFTQDNLEIIVGTEEEVVPQEIRDEVAAKVHIKTWAWEGDKGGVLGFGKNKHLGDGHHGGKILPARNADDYGTNSSGEKGLVTTEDNIYLDKDEILAVIDVTKQHMKVHEDRGTIESDDYQNLKDELTAWQWELKSRELQEEEDELREGIINFHEGK